MKCGERLPEAAESCPRCGTRAGLLSGPDVKNGGVIAVILSVIILATMSWLPGIVTLIGGVLCYTSK